VARDEFNALPQADRDRYQLLADMGSNGELMQALVPAATWSEAGVAMGPHSADDLLAVVPSPFKDWPELACALSERLGRVTITIT
jgi:hypothetical protein